MLTNYAIALAFHHTYFLRISRKYVWLARLHMYSDSSCLHAHVYFVWLTVQHLAALLLIYLCYLHLISKKFLQQVFFNNWSTSSLHERAELFNEYFLFSLPTKIRFQSHSTFFHLHLFHRYFVKSHAARRTSLSSAAL